MTNDAFEPRWAIGNTRPPAWQSEGREVVFESPWMQVTRNTATAPTGDRSPYAVMRPKNNAAGVLPVHDDGTVTLVGQQRFALGNYSWEMPEGGAPHGEDPLDGAKRELAEETGLAAEHWMSALTLELSNSITDEMAYTWIAWGLSAVPTDPDPTEALAVVRVPFLDLIEEIARGTVRDAMTVATAYRAYHMAVSGQLPPTLAQAMLGKV